MQCGILHHSAKVPYSNASHGFTFGEELACLGSNSGEGEVGDEAMVYKLNSKTKLTLSLNVIGG